MNTAPAAPTCHCGKPATHTDPFGNIICAFQAEGVDCILAANNDPRRCTPITPEAGAVPAKPHYECRYNSAAGIHMLYDFENGGWLPESAGTETAVTKLAAGMNQDFSKPAVPVVEAAVDDTEAAEALAEALADTSDLQSMETWARLALGKLKGQWELVKVTR